jgi:hypothetical protein
VASKAYPIIIRVNPRRTIMVHPMTKEAVAMCNDTIKKYQHTMQNFYLDWEVQEIPNPKAPGGVVYVSVPVIAVEMKW